MKNRVVFITAMLALWLISSCSAADQSFETRQDFAVQFNQKRLASTKNEIQTKWSKDILAALGSVQDAASNPVPASAVFVKRKAGTYGLFVFWIENSPSVDGVEFQFSDQVSPVVIATPEVQLKQNQSSAKDTIVFGGEYRWDDRSPVWKSLERVTSARDMKVRLLRVKAPATGWFSVDFYNVDRWILDAPKTQ